MAAHTLCKNCDQWHDPMLGRCPPTGSPLISKPKDQAVDMAIRAKSQASPAKLAKALAPERVAKEARVSKAKGLIDPTCKDPNCSYKAWYEVHSAKNVAKVRKWRQRR